MNRTDAASVVCATKIEALLVHVTVTGFDMPLITLGLTLLLLGPLGHYPGSQPDMLHVRSDDTPARPS